MTNETLKKAIVNTVSIAVVCFVGVAMGTKYNQQKKENAVVEAKNAVTKMNSICPSLLSISRSSRDTLIVMKAEPLCNTYVMENLK